MNACDKVLVLLPMERNKLLMQWFGRSEIEEKKGIMDYQVKVNGKSKILHANLLKQYVERQEVKATMSDALGHVNLRKMCTLKNL